MNLRGKTVVVTGGAGGIGRALAERFKQEGVRGLTIADLDGARAAGLARDLDALGLECDVTREEDIRRVIEATRAKWGEVDLFCSNAGILLLDPDVNNAASASDESFERCWRVHVMAHIYAARALLPSMIERRSGYFLNTVSAAGLLSQIGSTTYSTTKHAAIGFAESLAIAHRNHGIRVSILCPQAVGTNMYTEARGAEAAGVDGVLTPEAVADAALLGIQAERFLILPHPQVSGYVRRKADDYDRWIGGMARFRDRIMADCERE